jgi:hypothetical protein
LNKLTDNLRENACIIDAFNVLSDRKISILKQSGFIVLGVGKGHIRYL